MEEALRSMLRIYLQGMPLHSRHAAHLLRNLEEQKDLASVRCLHSIFASMERAPSAADIADDLIPSFASHQSLFEVGLVFSAAVEPSARSYHGVIAAYVGIRDGAMSFEMYERMHSEGIQSNEFTFPCILKVCRHNRAIKEGLLVHNHIVCLGFEAHAVIGNTLIDMYTKCGSLDMALMVFNELPDRTLVSWSTLIRGYTQLGQGLHALELFQKMQQAKIQPDMVILSCVSKACCMLGLVEHGKLIHDQMIRSEFGLDVVAGNTLIDMYSKCGWLNDACDIFSKLRNPSLMSWGAMLAGYVQNGQDIHALSGLHQMQSKGVIPDKVVYLCAVTACASLRSLRHGRTIHTQILSNNLDSYTVIRNALIDMYTRCGEPGEGCKMFDSSENQDASLCATTLATHVRNGLALSALETFARMQRQGVRPDEASLSCALKACGQTNAFLEGRLVHHQIISNGFESDLVVGNNLINMYANCGSLMDACHVFDRLPHRNAVSFSAIMAGYAAYAQHGPAFPVVEIFEKMLNDNVKPDEYVFSCALKACSVTCSLSEGKWIHSQLLDSGVKMDMALGSTLVEMYSKCGEFEEACKVFYDLESRDIVSWGAMIAGCVMQGNCGLSFHLYSEMKSKGVETNAYIMLSILKACGLIGATCQGKILHDEIVKRQLESDVFVESALIDMYASCECINEASKVREASRNWNLVSWGALVSGYAQGANPKLAMNCVERMKVQGLTPNEAIYTSILSACAHAGQIEKSFNSLVENEGIAFSTKHYNCIADAYARTGHLRQASELLHSLPSPPDTYGWASLCSASNLHAWQYGPQNSVCNLEAGNGSGL